VSIDMAKGDVACCIEEQAPVVASAEVPPAAAIVNAVC